MERREIRDCYEASMPPRISLRSIWAALATEIDEVDFGSYFPMHAFR
jgi:hypothetical protein